MRTVDYEVYLIETSLYWYVGSTTIGSDARWDRHRSGHGNAHLLTAKIKDLGPEAFDHRVLEQDCGHPIKAERRWYDWYLAHDPRQSLNGRAPGGWSDRTGKTHPPEVRSKISAALKGHILSTATRAKISKSRQGQLHTPSTRSKMSATMLSSEVQAKLKQRYACECGSNYTPSGLARHCKATGHQRKQQ